MILRICQQGQGDEAMIHTRGRIEGAWLTDLTELEWHPIAFEETRLMIKLPAHGVRTIGLALTSVEE